MNQSSFILSTAMDNFNKTLPLHKMAKASSVTFNMIKACLRSCHILAAPERVRSSFRWAVDITDGSSRKDHSFDDRLVFIAPYGELDAFLCEHELPADSLFVVLIEGNEIPDDLPSRTLLIQQTQEYSHYVKRIQGLFFATWLWEIDLNRVTYMNERRGKRGQLQEAVDTMTSILPEFVCITDTGFNLIAYSDTVEPPTEEYRSLIENECYSHDEIFRIKDRVIPKAGPRSTTVVLPPDECCPFYTIHLPLFIQGLYLFHLTMVCSDSGMLEVSKDIFSIFSTYVEIICVEFWSKHLEVESSCHKALIKMIEQADMTDLYIRTQLENTVIPTTRFFRLLRYPISPDLPWETSRMALDNAVELFPGYSYPFMYRGDLIVLICSPTNNLAGVSLRKTLDRTTELMFNPYGLPCILSQPFDAIEDIATAYKQTKQALSCESILRAQYPDGYDGQGNFPIIPFEHTLQYTLFNSSADHDLFYSAFSKDIISLVSQEDRAQSTNLTGLLWVYLCNECNATETAKKLNMHRNTVIYHINKFERRFDLMLDLPMVRQRLYLDFVYHFATTRP